MKGRSFLVLNPESQSVSSHIFSESARRCKRDEARWSLSSSGFATPSITSTCSPSQATSTSIPVTPGTCIDSKHTKDGEEEGTDDQLKQHWARPPDRATPLFTLQPAPRQALSGKTVHSLVPFFSSWRALPAAGARVRSAFLGEGRMMRVSPV